MYNSIYPVNINYTKHQYKTNNQKKEEENASLNQGASQSFPNGAKVAIDYTKGQINISQVLADFKNTIIAINAPDDVKNEVYLYLNLVEKESLKENPSKEIVLSNLKNASRISDSYIATALGKKSNVVEGWIDALFLQRINLKSNPDEINPAFALDFPEPAKEKIELAQAKTPVAEQQNVFEASFAVPETSENIEENEISELSENIEVNSQIELSEEQNISSQMVVEDIKVAPQEIKTPFSAKNDVDKQARALFSKAKTLPNTSQGNTDKINLLNEALGILSSREDVNENIKAAIHLERGKIFDDYDYVDYALRDFYEATKAKDFNLRANAFYKSGQIYDEFNEFSPALDNYLSSVAYSGEADNIVAQTKVLSKIASLYSKQFDLNNVVDYSNLAIETAYDTYDNNLIADTYSSNAKSYQYMGQNDYAINNYKSALEIFSQTDESFEQMAYNYEQAALVMEKLGNTAKAKTLLAKSNHYKQKAQLRSSLMEQAS